MKWTFEPRSKYQSPMDRFASLAITLADERRLAWAFESGFGSGPSLWISSLSSPAPPFSSSPAQQWELNTVCSFNWFFFMSECEQRTPSLIRDVRADLRAVNPLLKGQCWAFESNSLCLSVFLHLIVLTVFIKPHSSTCLDTCCLWIPSTCLSDGINAHLLRRQRNKHKSKDRNRNTIGTLHGDGLPNIYNSSAKNSRPKLFIILKSMTLYIEQPCPSQSCFEWWNSGYK